MFFRDKNAQIPKWRSPLLLTGFSLLIGLVTLALWRQTGSLGVQQRRQINDTVKPVSDAKITLYFVEDENDRWCGYSTEKDWKIAEERVQDDTSTNAFVEYHGATITKIVVTLGEEDSGTTDEYALP